MKTPASSHTQSDAFSRRQFLRTSGAAVAGATALAQMPFVLTSHAAPDDPIRIGLVGCGGRGMGAIANVLGAQTDVNYPQAGYHTENISAGAKTARKDVQVVALADVFEDRLNACREQLSKLNITIPGEKCFVGFDGLKKYAVTEVNTYPARRRISARRS